MARPDPNDFDPEFAGPTQWAEQYRGCGLQVIPGWMPGEPATGSSKRPYLSEWRSLQEALVADATFRRWYDPATGEHRKRRNMGIITGAASGQLLILDLDTNPKALQWWLGVCAVHNHGMEPETARQKTGGGGQHLLFRVPPGWVPPTGTTSIGVDVRGQGGYAVMPPSLHDSGRFYEWLPGHAPWETPIAEAPAWLLEEIDKLFGSTSQQRAANPQPGSRPTADPQSGDDFDAFGHRIDGREQAMRDLIWAALVGFYLTNPICPGKAEQDQVFADWVSGHGPKQPLPGETKEQGLEREGRGRTLFDEKWLATLRKWDTEIPAAAAERKAKEDAAKASSPPPPQPDPAKPVGGIPLVSAFPIDGVAIPVRNWVITNVLLKRAVATLIAPPGSGKSLFTLQLGIAIASNTAWSGWMPRRSEKVLILNTEDDHDEMDRRLFAAAGEMKIEQSALEGRILMPKADAVSNMVVATFDNRTKSVMRTPLLAQLKETITTNGIGVVVVDPFAETFEVDENSNSQVKWAGLLWREVARETGCALMLVHHTKKYASDMAGDADAGRGGGAMIGIARVIATLFAMTEDEAVAMDVAPDARHGFVRFDDAKQNYALKGSVRWFEKKTIALPNGTAFDPPDNVGVLVPWEPPDALEGLSVHDLNAVLDIIDRGLADASGRATGQFYTPTATGANSHRWVGRALKNSLECSDEAAKAILKRWFKNEVLEVFDYTDPVLRKPRKGVRSVLSKRPGKETYREEL